MVILRAKCAKIKTSYVNWVDHQMTNEDKELILTAINNFKVNYRDIHASNHIETKREELLLHFANLIDDINPSLRKKGDLLNIPSIDIEIRAAITKKLSDINRYAKFRKLKIVDSIPLSSDQDALRFRLTREDIELLIANKKKKREINCHVINGETPCSVSNFLENIIKNGQKRTQLIFKIASSEHWSTLDIQREEDGTLKIFFLDAIGHTTNLPEVDVFCYQHEFELTQSMGGVQKDFSSCSIFCMDHALHLSKIPDLHEQLSLVRTKEPKKGLTYSVDPIDLPPTLVKNAQSTSFIDKYLNKHPEHLSAKINTKGQTLKEYTESHQVIVDSQTVYSAVVYKQARYRKKVNQDKEYVNDPQYHEKMTLSAEQTIATASQDILNIKVDFEPKTTINSIAFYYQALLLKIEEIRTNRVIRDAHTVLNLRQPPPALQNAIEQKRKEICSAMQGKILGTHDLGSPVKSTEAQMLEQRIKLLHSMNYDRHLLIFKEKITEMKDKSKENANYVDAAKKAEKFYKALEAAKLKFLQEDLEQTTQKLKLILGAECQAALQEARSALEKHREWKGAIKRFVIEVLSFLTLGLINDKLSKFSRTDSVKKIDEFDSDLTNGGNVP